MPSLMGSLEPQQKLMPITVANLNVFGYLDSLLGEKYNATTGAGLPANRASRATTVAGMHGVPSYEFTCFTAKINANHSG